MVVGREVRKGGIGHNEVVEDMWIVGPIDNPRVERTTMAESRLDEIKREERTKQEQWESFRKQLRFNGLAGIDEAMELVISASWRMGYDQGFDVAYDIGYGEGFEDGRDAPR